MSEPKKAPDQWKSETSREERKNRLAALKAKDGGKKPIRFNNKAFRSVVAIILVVAILVIGSWYAVRMGVPASLLTAATIGGEKIKGTELNFYYYSIASQYGISPTTAEGEKMLNGPSNIDGFDKLSDYVKDGAAKELQNIVMLSTKAKNDGLKLGADDAKRINDYISSAKTQADSEGITLDALLAKTFGAGMNQATMLPILDRILLANLYSKKKTSEFTFTDAELTTYYDANKDNFDVVEYRQFLITADNATAASQEVITLAMAAAKSKAEQMLAQVNDDATFKAAAVTFAKEADKLMLQSSEDITLSKNTSKANMVTTEVGTWAFDAARKAGDKIVSETTEGYYVILFKSRARADFNIVSVRHILIGVERKTAMADAIGIAKTKAEKVLSDYKAGAQTAEAFGVLATANTTDTGSAETGGLYEGIKPGDMVVEFDSWCFDPARKTGDTGIVQTDYGFHIMYFEKVDGVDWKIKVKEQLKAAAYEKYVVDEQANFPYALNQIGAYFVG